MLNHNWLFDYTVCIFTGWDIMAYTDEDNSKQSCLPTSADTPDGSVWQVHLCLLLSEASEEGRVSCVYQYPPRSVNVYVVLSSVLSSVSMCEATFIPWQTSNYFDFLNCCSLLFAIDYEPLYAIKSLKIKYNCFLN